MKEITSRTNPTVQYIVKIATSSKARTDKRLFVAEGLRTCVSLYTSGLKLNQLFVTGHIYLNQKHEFESIPENLITVVTDHVMEKISQATTPSGMLGLFHMPQAPQAITGPGLVLAQVREPGNVGTLIRSCAAFGMRTVVLIESADVWSHKVVQATAGTLGMVDIFVLSWEELLACKNNYKLCALTVHDGTAPAALDFTNSLLIVGNEANGIPEVWLKECEQRITLSMPGDAESLNAAVAGSIGLYEMSRTR